MPNLLAQEKSLYLRGHADNPVDWFPWGAEALAKAKAEDKPLLVSIGYSACHWCHVMAHESFEDEYIAKLMNEHFICIKVDREERPDLDQIYMEAVQMMNSHGGWPLNVFCLPDGRPFAGGTYFPPDDSRPGMIPWPQLLMRVSDFYRRSKDQLIENAQAILGNIDAGNNPLSAIEPSSDNAALLAAAQSICQNHDDENGGFGGAPKFPPSMMLNFLFEVRNSAAVDDNDPGFAQRIDQVINTTLTAMARGGIYDQIGGGFARYSVDGRWLIPHFEKMLYDNGLLLEVFTRGWLRYHRPLYRAVVEETIDWLQRDMLAGAAGFCSAIDADSEGEEGKFYVWNPAQMEEVLGAKDASAFCRAYGITDSGNFEHGSSNPALADIDFETRQSFARSREKLLQVRSLRVPPGKDSKRLIASNSLVIRALADAGFYFGCRKWLETARKCADWIWENLRFDTDRLHSVFYEDGPQLNGYLDDYAYYAEALLSIAAKIDWLDPGASTRYIDRARMIVDSTLIHFHDDTSAPGFFFVSDDHEKLVSRKKAWVDNATPSGNSSLVHALAGLFALTGNSEYRRHIDSLREAYAGFAERSPGAVPYALAGFTNDAVGVAVIKIKGVKSLDDLQQALAAKPFRRTFLLYTDDPDQPEGYQLCIGTTCLEPSQDVADLTKKI